MSAVPSQDQVMAQLRILIPSICTALTAFGVSSTEAGSYQQIALASLAPISYVIVAIWSIIANTQANKIKSVQDIATGVAGPPAVSAQKALIQATSAVAQDKTIPASDDAKNTLIAATIALPEVQTIVTDKKTADASPSNSVVAG